jgi:CAAX protease family protein
MNQNKRSDQLSALFEFTIFVGFALIAKRLVDEVLWRYAGPITLVASLILLTIYMRLRGRSWSDMGLPPLPGLRAKLKIIPQSLLVLVAFIAVLAPLFLLGPALGLTFLEEVPAGVNERWGDVQGNLKLYLLWMGIVWTSAAFGEEMFFRGFMITQLQRVFSNLRLCNVLSVVIPALIFGYGHMYYQGLRGFVVTGLIGLAFGVMFLFFKRSLWPLILFHGVIDSLTFTSMFMGWE